jgi:hypothetical protein
MYKSKSNSALFGRYLEGDELQLCYDTETEFPTRLTWVKAKTLYGIRPGSWVGSGPDRVRQVKVKSLFGAVGLAGIR